MIRARTVAVRDPLARANVMAALAGPGGPAGVIACTEHGAELEVRFDDERSAAELIDTLIELGARFVPEAAPELADLDIACALAAQGLDEPALDATRVIEAYLR